MDENSSPVSTPGSTNSSPVHYSTYELVSPLQAKSNHSRYEVPSDGKKHATISSPVRSPLSDKNTSTIISPHRLTKQRTSPAIPKPSKRTEPQPDVVALQQELNTLKTTVKTEGQRTTRMIKWEKTMTELMQKYKEIHLDMADSVDMLVEFDQIEPDLVKDKQDLEDKQRAVDDLMNIVPERIYQIEQLKQQLV